MSTTFEPPPLASGEAPPTILVVDDDADIRALLRRWLTLDGFRVECVDSGEAALQSLTRMLPDAVCLDLELPGWSGNETLARIKAQNPRLPVLILTANGAIETVVTAMRSGAWDYLVKPIERLRLTTTLHNAVDHSRMSVQVAQLEREVSGRAADGMVGDSLPMRALLRQIDRVAPTSITVLIRGESGTGKELIARAIHEGSARRDAPYVALNCAAVPETLQESELFGHEKGAFTGAAARHQGRFEQAHQGTLFLDEVAELSLSLQAKLLRVLQERRFHRVGGGREVTSDFRLVAASHRDLSAEVAAGRFREDLYFRLAVFELDVPPLRARGRDVITIAESFLASFGAGSARTLSADARRALQAYRWPGNVRELRNAIERASIVASGSEIQLEDLPPRIWQQTAESAERAAPASTVTRVAEAAVTPSGETLDDLERVAILDVLRKTQGNRTEAGRRLGIGRSTLYRKLKKYGIDE